MNEVRDRLSTAIGERRLLDAARMLAGLDTDDVIEVLYRLPEDELPLAFRLLPKEEALEVFERIDPGLQRDLVDNLSDAQVARVFEGLDPDERVRALDELPAKIATRIIGNLSEGERAETAIVLGYAPGTVGRAVSPVFLRAFADEPASAVLERLREQPDSRESLYTFPVVDRERRLIGLVGLRELVTASPSTAVAELMDDPEYVVSDEPAEIAAQECLRLRLLALPVVDHEHRLVGLLAIDDAARIIDDANEEDAARAGASEPLTRPYLLTSVFAITRARVVWLLVLAVSAILTVNVLEIFEATLEQRVALALFIPLLTGVGGNTGSQAAVTVTRAIATDEVRPRDLGRVAFKELATGLLLGTALGVLGFSIASLVYGVEIGTVIGLTLLAVCGMAATVGGSMPIIAKSIRVDPAVFSTPFISTFCDATGLLIYFGIATSVLGL